MKNSLLLSSVLVMASTGMASDVYATTTPVPKPVISPIGADLDAEVGQQLKIPLSVSNTVGTFDIVAKPLLTGATFATDTSITSLPTKDFLWTPGAGDANKIYTVTFTAKETTGSKLKSKPVKTKIHVWPVVANRDTLAVHKLLVSTVHWDSSNSQLTLSGKVILNNLLTPADKTTFLARTDLTLNISQGTTGTPEIAATEPVIFDTKGNFTVSAISLTGTFKCNLTVDFEGIKATRKIGGAPKTCVK